MKKIETALAVAALCAACSQGAPSTSETPATSQTASAAATPNRTLPPLTADDLLQARLRRAAKEYEADHAVREPEQYGMIGLLGSDKPSGTRAGGMTMSGRRAPEDIQRIVRQSFGRFRRCYEQELQKNPKLQGKVVTEFAIGGDGKPAQVKTTGDMPDEAVKTCVNKAFASLDFGKGEPVNKVTYPIQFSSADDAPPAPPTNPSDPLALPSSSLPPGPLTPPSPPSPVRKMPPPEGPWPIIAIDGTKVLMDGRVVGDTTVIAQEAKLKKVDGLFDAMKAWREDWKTKNPETRFLGLAGLRVAPGTSVIVMKSVFQSMAYAGFPEIYMQSAADPASIHALAAQIPRPPDPAGAIVPEEPPRWLSVLLLPGEVTVTWKKGAEVVAEVKMPPADLGKKVCESWKELGEHRSPDDPLADRLVVSAANALGYGDVDGALKAIESCKRSGPDGKERPAFWYTLTVR